MLAIPLLPYESGAIALVDGRDFGWLADMPWRIHWPNGREHTPYAAIPLRTEDRGTAVIYMHRTILDAPDGTDVDHVDGNGLNNCRANIRLCTRAENVRNRRKSTHPKGVAPSSPFKGVSRYTARLWAANICVNYSHIALGTFATETDAALAYDAAARIHFGAFARVNFPRAGEQAA